MSGITRTPRSWRIASAASVVGPLAPSITRLAFTRSALSSWICEPTAAGTRTSQACSISSAFDIGSVPGKSTTLPCSFTCAWSFDTSRPSSFQIAPSMSPTPTMAQPSFASRRATTLPTLPNPWITTRLSRSSWSRW